MFFTGNEYNDKKNISKKLNSSITDDKYSFGYGMKKSITNIIDSQIVPWLYRCFLKYPPKEFHRWMDAQYEFDGITYHGFDFFADWNLNHRRIFTAFKMARKMNKYIDFDVDKIYLTIMSMMREKGYDLRDYERQCIRHTLVKVHRIIYL